MKKKITIELETEELGLFYKFLRRTSTQSDIEQNFAGAWKDPQQLKRNVETTVSAIDKVRLSIRLSLPDNAPELDY